jgi:hypothetical protein
MGLEPSFSARGEVSGELGALRDEVRSFLGERSADWSTRTIAQSWVGFDRQFSLEVGARGWIGMTWPRRYGGGERSWQERYVVLEEMLACGAPIGAHSTGDRQSGPLLLRVGSDQQKREFLPRLARGEISICIGLSEPDTGSDLASLRTSAVPYRDGWKISGRKIWTTNAHRSEFMLALVRTGDADDRRTGLSQFLIDLASPGIEIKGIRDLTGEEHFNEVTFDDAYVDRAALVGRQGEGWQQVTAELAMERSGPDRFMSNFMLLPALLDCLDGDADRLAAMRLGEAICNIAVLRELSVSISGDLATGALPDVKAAIYKELGVSFEQRLPAMVREAAGEHLSPRLVALLDDIDRISPSFSLRGGTREIMLGIIARGIGVR